jgi:uncharacterized metal-binding protein YceD (DUF177 family)
MSAKRHILPQWVAESHLHPGWAFDGEFPIDAEIQAWVPGAQWPQSLPLKLAVESAPRGRWLLDVVMQAHAELPCQRCGEALSWSAELDQQVLLTPEEDPKNGQAQWEMADEKVQLRALVATELSLALPDFPRHAHCDLQELE